VPTKRKPLYDYVDMQYPGKNPTRQKASRTSWKSPGYREKNMQGRGCVPCARKGCKRFAMIAVGPLCHACKKLTGRPTGRPRKVVTP
jgi:hypothetical protein